MFGQTKNRRPVSPLVAPQALECREAIVKSRGQNMHGCLVPVDEAAIHPNFFACHDHRLELHLTAEIHGHHSAM